MNRPHLCDACRDSGWIGFSRDMGDGTRRPWAAACLCEKGRTLSAKRDWEPSRKDHPPHDPAVVQPVDREVYHARLEANTASDYGSTSTPERRRAALAYVVASFRTDPQPERMVAEIIAGRADHVVRTILGPKLRQAA